MMVTWHISGRGEVHVGFWRANLQGKDHPEDLDLDAKILNWTLLTF